MITHCDVLFFNVISHEEFLFSVKYFSWIDFNFKTPFSSFCSAETNCRF